jgi:hypothetical protein
MSPYDMSVPYIFPSKWYRIRLLRPLTFSLIKKENIHTLEEWGIRSVIIFIKTMATPITEISHTVHGGILWKKSWLHKQIRVNASV